jgi:hypothetical protein
MDRDTIEQISRFVPLVGAVPLVAFYIWNAVHTLARAKLELDVAALLPEGDAKKLLIESAERRIERDYRPSDSLKRARRHGLLATYCLVVLIIGVVSAWREYPHGDARDFALGVGNATLYACLFAVGVARARRHYAAHRALEAAIAAARACLPKTT